MSQPASFDDSNPGFNVATLPLVIEGLGDQAVLDAIGKTTAHLGLMRFQLFVNAMAAHWPDAIKNIQVRSPGDRSSSKEMSFCCDYEDTRSDDANMEAFDVFNAKLYPLSGDGFAPMAALVDKVFNEGKRKVRREDLPGLLFEAMDEKMRARLQQLTLQETLPGVRATPAPKPKF